jgi:hypothetical protein
MISLFGVAGSIIRQDPNSFSLENYPIDRDFLDLPDVLLESYPTDSELLDRVRPTLDALRNAGGHLESPGNDKWKQKL